MYCAHCGTNNPPELEACDRCGELLVRPDTVQPHHLGVKTCPDCATANDAHGRFCIECGRNIESVMPIGTVPPPAGPAGTASPVIRPRPTPRPTPRAMPPVSRPRPVKRPARPSVATENAAVGAGADDLRGTPAEPLRVPNNSGTRDARLPEELRGWNWGAFLMPAIWGVFNRVWIGLIGAVIGFTPGMPTIVAVAAYVIFAFMMGIRGNEWAWRARRWESVQHFRRIQKSWMTWGFIGFIALGVPLLLALLPASGN